ncbi:MAG: pyridoxamine 5'-phosphate oxidase family protein [Microlunatus sp.]|nr:pyridoxamine 5'-phosphate oxidase family protein [Microlunatus sp.]MDN5804106.1 pyridoxamine 5'-phosphate oxidase family protein [Microlunatus sp.]
MPRSEPQHRRFNSLPTTECLALLRSHPIGRVGWNSSEGQQILPVTYVLRDGDIVFRTSAYGALSELREPHPVAFEVDDFDIATRTGWSVLVQGTAAASTDLDGLSTLWQQQGPVPWATGTRSLFITIRPDQMSGRVIST